MEPTIWIAWFTLTSLDCMAEKMGMTPTPPDLDMVVLQPVEDFLSTGYLRLSMKFV